MVVENMDEKHTVTLRVSSRTCEIFKIICNSDSRCPGNQIVRFLKLMSGESKPYSMLSMNCFEVETKLYRAFSSLQKLESNRKRVKIIPFPIMLEGCN